MSGKKKNKQQDPVLALLQKELVSPGGYSETIAAAVEEHFAGIWDPIYEPLKVSKVTLELYQAENQIVLAGTVFVSCAGKTNCYHYKDIKPVPMCGDDGETGETIRLALPQLKKTHLAGIKVSLPQNAETIRRRYIAAKHPKLDAMATEIAGQPHVQAMLETRKEAIQNWYAGKLAKETCPPGFRPVRIASLSLHCYTRSDVGKCVLKIYMNTGVYLEKEFALGDCSFYIVEERQRQYLQTNILECLTSLVQLGGIPLMYTAPSLWTLPGMTNALKTVFRQGTVTLGCVEVRLSKCNYQGEPLLYLPKYGDGRVRCGKKDSSFLTCPALPLCPAELDQPVLPLGQYAKPPREMVGLFRLGEALEKRACQAVQGKGVPAPQMVLELCRKGGLILYCGSRRLALKPKEKDTGLKLLWFVTRAVESETRKPLEMQRQLETLNGLNPTEMYILRYITANGETASVDVIKDQGSAVKAYASACLQHLTEVEVPVDGYMVPLLRVRTVPGDSKEGRCLYRVGAGITQGVLASATGRPYTAAEAANLIPAVRGRWFTNYLLDAVDADDEHRWTRFGEALDDMPRTFLIDFAKSEAGQAFLRRFTGDEAMFVRLAVESLLGCKQLAVKLWPETEKEDGGT